MMLAPNKFNKSQIYTTLTTLPEIGRVLYPLTSSDQDRISPNNIKTTSITLIMRIQKNINWDHRLIQYQILRANIIKVVQQIVRRITYEIISMKGLNAAV